MSDLVAEIVFPPEWLERRSWLLGPQLVLALTSETGERVFIAGGVLDDGTNLIGMCHPAGQQLMRAGPDTRWQIEQRSVGDPPVDGLARTWAQVCQSFRAGIRDTAIRQIAERQ